MITVYIEDPRLFLRVVGALRSRGISFRVPMDPEPRCPSEGIVLTDRPEYYDECRERVVIVDDAWERRLEDAIAMDKGRQGYGVLLVGVDPGEPPAYVVIADDAVLEQGVAEPRILVERIRAALRRIPHRKAVVRIGDSGRRLDEIIEALADKPLRSARVELVDEHSTSRANPRFREVRDRDVAAAINIAYKKGLRLEAGSREEDEG